MPVLNPAHYTVAWIAPLEIEARAALLLLDDRHPGGFPLCRGDDYIFLPGDVCGHNVIIATLPAGQEYGNGSAAAIASQVKKCFSNLWFGLLVGVAAGLPNFSRSPPLDIRLGDVLVSLPEGDSPALVAYDLGKETEHNGFHLVHGGRVLSATETVVRSAIGKIKLEAPNDAVLFLPYYEEIKDKEHFSGSFIDPGQENDIYRHIGDDETESIKLREPRPGSRRTRVWYGPLGSGEKLMKNARKRNELRDRYNIIGLEMEAAGTMNRIAVGVVRGVCDYGDEHKNKQWQPYAAAMAAAYAKAILAQITPGKAAQDDEAEAPSNLAKSRSNSSKRPLEESAAIEATSRSTRHRVAGPNMQSLQSFTGEDDISARLNNTEEEALLQSLAFDQIDDRHNTIETALADTCQWLLHTSSFRDWLDPRKLDEHHGFLWIKGKPGAGKSTLMKFALQNSQQAKRSNIIFFFFNARGEDLEKSTTGMYRSLLLQLFERLPRLRHVLNCFRFTIKNGSIPRWTTQHLKSLFSQAMHSLRESPLMLFIDALDECDEDQVRDMVAFFQDVAGKAQQKATRLQICFASRFYPQITIEKGIHLDIGSQEGHGQDITTYVKRKLRIGQDKVARKIRATLIDKASGVFMWVVLVVRILQKVFDTGNKHMLEDRLQKTPEDLNALFHDILTRDDHRQNELLWCLQWILFARRPLSPGQLREAVFCGVSPNHARAWLREGVEENDVKHFIIDCSKGLAEITKSKRNPSVQFIHESVRGFLLEHGRLQNLWPECPDNFKGQSQERLKQCCLEYCRIILDHGCLDLPTKDAAASSMKEAATQFKSSRRLQRESRRLTFWDFPFLEYAVRNVLYHADAAEAASIDQGQFLASFPLSDWIKLESLVEQYGARQHSENVSLLYILSEYNAVNLIKRYPNNLAGFQKEDQRYGLPILTALATGCQQAVLALMEAHADKEPRNPVLQDICKQYACGGDDERQRFEGRQWRFLRSESVLLNLVKTGNEFLVDFALASAQCDAVTEAAKLLDCTLEDTSMARILLKHDATMALIYRDEARLRTWAASHGFTEILQALVARGGTLEMTGLDDNTSLLAPATAGHTGTVRMLSGGDAHMRARNSLRTPLSWAIMRNHETTAQLLLDSGARFENALIDSLPPLCWAARHGREAIVRWLIDMGANVEAADEDGRTPLSWAARQRNEAILRMLIDKGANVEAADEDGRTPMSWAAGQRNEAILRMLIDKGANVEAADVNGHTPLRRAINIEGHTLLIGAIDKLAKDSWSFLMDRGADVNKADARGYTALHWAGIRGYGQEPIPLLIEEGANTEAVDTRGRTALFSAFERAGSLVSASELIDYGANVEAADFDGYRPLH